MVSAGNPVDMASAVTARERYLWTLELRRRGRSEVIVLGECMNGRVEE